MPGPVSQSYEGPDDGPIEIPGHFFGEEPEGEERAIPGPGQFLCEMCGRVFDMGDDDEARSEAESKGLNPDDCGLVCDDCYDQTPWGSGHSPEEGVH